MRRHTRKVAVGVMSMMAQQAMNTAVIGAGQMARHVKISRAHDGGECPGEAPGGGRSWARFTPRMSCTQASWRGCAKARSCSSKRAIGSHGYTDKSRLHTEPLFISNPLGQTRRRHISLCLLECAEARTSIYPSADC